MTHSSIYTIPLKEKKKKFQRKEMTFEAFVQDPDPYETIESGKIMARAWAKSLPTDDQSALSQTFILRIIEAYWQKIHNKSLQSKPLPDIPIAPNTLDKSIVAVAHAVGNSAAELDVIEASYLLGNVYTAVLPETVRANQGIFYTPPSLTHRLIQIAEAAGVNWASAKIIDPACGGGAFLAPVCLKILSTLKDRPAKPILEHIQNHVAGLEIDPFGGWLTQVFVEVALKDVMRSAGVRIQSLVRISNSLLLEEDTIQKGSFDLVIGNPPYGKVKMTDDIRDKFKDSLYGHPNLYGLFTHLALDLVADSGIIGFLTPTSFLSGEYFKNLRRLIRKQAIPVEIDFVSFRKGVFEDVLQETMLAIYKKQVEEKATVNVNQITTTQKGDLDIRNAGFFQLSTDLTSPWILPRSPLQAAPVQAMKKMTFKLKDWGYKVSTGPLVWNRHKKQFHKKAGTNTYPVVWAEAVTQDGRFVLKAEKKNHEPYFEPQAKEEWLITSKPCILLQRTTAKEQNKRLVAAALPEDLLQRTKGVVIENHLNMIIPIINEPLVSPSVLAAFLNSKAVNESFRTISGSVAVSAYELESLPLPAPEKLANLCELVNINSDMQSIEIACQKIYSLNNGK